MIILEFLGKVFTQVIFEGIIIGFFRFIGGLFDKSRNSKNKKNREKIKLKKLEKEYLYKEIELTQNLNSKIKYGTKGAILEIIDMEKVFAEFYDRNGKQIEWNNELVFEIGFNQFKLKK